MSAPLVRNMSFWNWLNSHTGLITITAGAALYVVRATFKTKSWVDYVNSGLNEMSAKLDTIEEKLDRVLNESGN